MARMDCVRKVRGKLSNSWRSLGGTLFTRALKIAKLTAYFFLFVCCIGLNVSKLNELFSNNIGTEIKIKFAYEHALPTVAFCRYAYTSNCQKNEILDCIKPHVICSQEGV